MPLDVDAGSGARAFIAVDLQNDFCPGGALAVAGGDAVIPLVNELATRFDLAVATQDWHPLGHVSFASSHPGARPYESVTHKGETTTLWPDHCVQGSPGADFHPGLDQRPYRLVLRKGHRPGLDSYSAFFENDRVTPTGLHGYLSGLGVGSVVLAGLAFDYCVLYSALDAARLGYRVSVVIDATRAVSGPVDAATGAIAAMRSAGVRFVTGEEVFE